jgi:hypothetical protein
VIGGHVYILLTYLTGGQACKLRYGDLLFCLFADDNSGGVSYTNVELVLKRSFIAGRVLHRMRRKIFGVEK